MLAGAAGDPGVENAGDGQVKLRDALLDPARGAIGEDRRQVADEPLGKDDEFARGLDRPLHPRNCIHDPMRSRIIDGT